MSIFEDTERTRFYGQTDKVIPVYPHFNFVEVGGIIISTDGLVQDYSNSIANALEWVNEWLNLTHWGRDEMNSISQMTFSIVFSSMKFF